MLAKGRVQESMCGSLINPVKGRDRVLQSAEGFYRQVKAKALSAMCSVGRQGEDVSLRSLRSSQGALLEQLCSGLGGPAECRSLLYIHSTFNPPHT